MQEKEVYKIFENAITGYLLTVKIIGDDLWFNHQTMHDKDEYESFQQDDVGLEVVNNVNMYHINGKILNPDEYHFLIKIIEDL